MHVNEFQSILFLFKIVSKIDNTIHHFFYFCHTTRYVPYTTHTNTKKIFEFVFAIVFFLRPYSQFFSPFSIATAVQQRLIAPNHLYLSQFFDLYRETISHLFLDRVACWQVCAGQKEKQEWEGKALREK